MLQELNFQQEANNVEQFREFLVTQQLTKVATAPRIYREFTTEKILTMEYLGWCFVVGQGCDFQNHNE
jgi:aarF domain-containing kinase